MKTRTLLLAALLWPGIAPAQDAPDPAARQVYFGEQHLHTQDSPDAFFMGTRNTPDEAYRFCKGEAIQKKPSGYTVRGARPGENGAECRQEPATNALMGCWRGDHEQGHRWGSTTR